MSHQAIRKVYEKRLQGWCFTQGLAVQFENQSFTPPAGANAEENVYLQCFLLPAVTEVIDLGGDITHYAGIVQINVVMPKNIGSKIGADLVQQIVDLFPLNLQLTTDSGLGVQIITPVAVSRGIPDADTYTIPTSFRYDAST